VIPGSPNILGPIASNSNRSHMKLTSDLRHAARSLLREPGFAVPAILMLGLGLGATSVVFSLVNGVLLKPLTYAEPDRLMGIREVLPDRPPVSFVARQRPPLHRVAQILPFAGEYVRVRSENAQPDRIGEPERLDAAIISANLFRVLGIRPTQGRDFRDDEEEEGKDTVAILTDGCGAADSMPTCR